MGDIIFNSSDVSNFILDLADNRYFVAHGRRVTLKGLSGNTIGSRQMAFVPNKLASYSTTAYMAAVSGSQTALIFINVATNDAQQGFIFSTDFHDVRMFRRSYQPLPGTVLLLVLAINCIDSSTCSTQQYHCVI